MLQFRPSSGLIVAAALCAAAPLRAEIVVPSSDEAQAALPSGLALIRRVLHIGQDEVVSHAVSLSSREASLELELSGGRTRTITLRGGAVVVDGERVGRYAPDGRLDRAWRLILADAGRLDTRGALAALHAWRARSLSADEAAAKARLDLALSASGSARQAAAAATVSAPAQAAGASDTAAARVERGVAIRMADLEALETVGRHLEAIPDIGPDLAAAVRGNPMHLGDFRVAAGQRLSGDVVVFRGTADIEGEVTGTVMALYGDVAFHRGAIIGRHAVSVGGEVRDLGGTVRGDIKTVSGDDLTPPIAAEGAEGLAEGERDAAAATARAAGRPSAWDRLFTDVRNVVAVFIALAMTGFGTVFFGRRYIEVVADTARHSFGRSLVAGFLGELLLLPTFAMLIVGLVFTIVGILLLPFAAVAFVLAAAGALLGGYLAIAHAIGETFTRRRMAHGAFVRAPNAYGYLFTGLIGLLGLWAAAALFGWAGPVVILFRVAAAVVTWLAVTAGFGAVLLSRAGLRETFAGRNFGEMSDEYLWATPPATPTASRMGMKG